MPPMNHIFVKFHMEILNRLVLQSSVKLLTPVKVHLDTGSVIPSILKKLIRTVLQIGYRNTRTNMVTAGAKNVIIIALFLFKPITSYPLL